MKKLHDFQKAIEQKQKRIENKEKFDFQPKYTLKEIEEGFDALRQSPQHIEQMKEDAKRIADYALKEYKELQDAYITLADEYKKLADLTKRGAEWSSEQSYLYGLVEHFICKNELEYQFIAFLEDVAKNETVEDYKNAAKNMVEHYHFDIDGNEFYSIEDEFGWMKEDEEMGEVI
jgi:predicted Zn-dependent protease